MVCRFCVDSEMYNPFSTLSNKFSYCPKKKTKCSPVKDGKRIIECESSGHPYDQYTRDRKCRCNYEEDYIPYFYNMETYNWTCSSFPKELSCYQSRCPRSEDGREQKRGQGEGWFKTLSIVEHTEFQRRKIVAVIILKSKGTFMKLLRKYRLVSIRALISFEWGIELL